MDIIENIKEIIKKNKKRIILPEGSNNKILLAASSVLKEELVDLIILGNKEEVINKYPILDKAVWINPKESDLFNQYVDKLYELRKEKGLTKEEVKSLLETNYMYFACLLILDNIGDGIVSGIENSSSDTLRPALQLIKGKERVSSFFIMDTNKKELGEEGVFIFSDCGLIQEPSINELALIGKQSMESFKRIIGKTPRVAYLSHSTYDSSKHEKINKVKEASRILKEYNPTYIIDGPMQLDSAIIPEIANIKCPNSMLKGSANILIFPDIDSGNIGYKLVEIFGECKAYGPLTQGLTYPVNDLSRGSSIEDIIGVIIITALQATKNMI